VPVLSEHQSSVTVHVDAPIVLEVTTASIEMDEEWMPYVQGTLTCPLGDGEIASIDPQADDTWVTVEIRRLLGRIDRVSDLTRKYRGTTLSDLTAQFAGGTLADVSASTYHDYEIPGHAKRSEERAWLLMLRETSIDWAAASVQIKLASGEARLTDWTHSGAGPVTAPGANLVARVNWFLEKGGFPEGLASWSGPNPTAIGDEATLTTGQTGIEGLQALTRKHEQMVWCDENGLWRMAPNRAASGTVTLRSSGPDRSVVNAVEKRSRDEGWVTAVILIYTWEGQTYYDTAYPGAPNPEKALVIRYDKPFPGTGRAAAMLKQLRPRGRALELVAVSTYDLTPGQTGKYVSPRGTLTGRVSAVRWQLPDDEMSVRIREVA
jgi:hypothetical protein